MPRSLRAPYRIVYNADLREYWPADTRSDVLGDKLREAREAGLDARLVEVKRRRLIGQRSGYEHST
jgi:hypothetical protein